MALLAIADCRSALRDDFPSLYALPADQADLDADVAAVDGVVYSYLGKRYQTPVTAAAALDVLKPLAKALFAETAYTIRGSGDEIPKKIATAADNARKMLTDISKGLVTIGGATVLAEQPAGGAEGIVVSGNSPEFTRDKMEGY